MDTKKLKSALEKELNYITKEEAKLRKKAGYATNSYKEKIESKIPRGINSALQKAFSKAFGTILKHGSGIIEKGFDKSNLSANYDIHNYAINKKANRHELKKLRWSAKKSDLLNLSITTVEGVGLGTLGIGFPDIVIFTGMILRGIYEVSLRYGYDYESTKEQYIILLMIKAALTKGDDHHLFSDKIDQLINSDFDLSQEELNSEIEETSKTFATDMLVLKFVQGLPLVGAVGGMFNPVYYNKIMQYVRLKYHKRYIIKKLNTIV